MASGGMMLLAEAVCERSEWSSATEELGGVPEAPVKDSKEAESTLTEEGMRVPLISLSTDARSERFLGDPSSGGVKFRLLGVLCRGEWRWEDLRSDLLDGEDTGVLACGRERTEEATGDRSGWSNDGRKGNGS